MTETLTIDDLVDIDDLAERTGYSKKTLKTYLTGSRHGHGDERYARFNMGLPLPVRTFGKTPVWSWPEVRDWLEKRR